MPRLILPAKRRAGLRHEMFARRDAACRWEVAGPEYRPVAISSSSTALPALRPGASSAARWHNRHIGWAIPAAAIGARRHWRYRVRIVRETEAPSTRHRRRYGAW